MTSTHLVLNVLLLLLLYMHVLLVKLMSTVLVKKSHYIDLFYV